MKHSILLAAACCVALQANIPVNYKTLSIRQSRRGQRFELQPSMPYTATIYIGTKEIRVGSTWFHIDSIFVWSNTSINYFTRQEDRSGVHPVISVAPGKDTPGVWQIILVWNDSVKMIQAEAQ